MSKVTQLSDRNWQRALKYNDKNEVTRDPGNAALLLTYHAQWRGNLEYDAFADRVYWRKLPKEDTGITAPRIGETLQDHHIIYAQHWLARFAGPSFGESAVFAGLVSAARNNTVHPLQRYLSSLKWDGVPRVGTWVVDYLDAVEEPEAAELGAMWLVSAVARAYRPGCQADHMLVLEGHQGLGKSSALRVLGGEWYLGSLPDIRDRKAAGEMLQGKWIIEIGELDALKGSNGTRIKDFLTQVSDDYRAPYAKVSQSRARTCVFAGTTNETTYIDDPSGARRFWPIKLRQPTAVMLEQLAVNRDMLFAEAVEMFRSGFVFWRAKIKATEVVEIQQARQIEDPWLERIASWIGDKDGVSVNEVLAGPLMMEPSEWSRAAQSRVGHILRKLVGPTRRILEHGQRVRRYYRDECVQPNLPAEKT